VDIYQLALRPLMFKGLKADPEQVHRQFMEACAQLEARTDRPWGTWLLQQLHRRLGYHHQVLGQELWGLKFANPVGLAAGFDKDGVASTLWPAFGFGFAELGTVTYHAQPGNPQPRLFRLPEDEAAINRMGFNNQGAAQMATVLAKAKPLRHHLQQAGLPMIPIGINLGKSKITPLEEAVADYCNSFKMLRDYADYGVINVSSPNTPGLRSLQSVEQLTPILSTLQQENSTKIPLLVKIAPDLAWEDITAIVQLAEAYGLAGIIATNTTINRDGLKTQRIAVTGNVPKDELGGLSGAPIRMRATEVIRFIRRQTKIPIVGVGGIFTAKDAWEKIAAGASLVQVYTGWTYEGPWMVRRILQGLVQALAAYGYPQITEVVGTDLPFRDR
jgi:dihydroorotate dehydrogenase